jgi:antitoxin FitA
MKGGMVDMASLTLRNIDESIKASLRLSAAEHGRSMEEEARQILKQFLLRKRSAAGIGSCISKRFAVIGGVDVPDVHRSAPRRPPTFFSDDAQ